MNMLVEERTISSRKAMSGAVDHLQSIGVEEVTAEEFVTETLPFIEGQVDDGQDIKLERTEDTVALKFLNASKILVREMIIVPEETSDTDATFDAIENILNKYKSTDA